MGIEITPQSIDEFNNLATLKIKFARGSLETPNRMVNRNDLYAKNNIGADIPLTSLSKSFLLQEIIDPIKLNNIININGFLGQVHNKLFGITNKINEDCIVILYVSFTENTKELIESEEAKYYDVIKFYLEIASFLGIEQVAVPIFYDEKKVIQMVSKRNLQLIPVLDLKQPTESFGKKFDSYISENSISVPIIGLKFATYLNANKGYDKVMQALDKLHEKHKATLMLDVPRYLKSERYKNLSTPHYTPFLVSDLVAEKYNIGGGSKNEKKNNTKHVRLFYDNLTVQLMDSKHDYDELDIESEKKVFEGDKKLQEMLIKILNNSLTENDWKYNRPSYLSRIHENIKTRKEFYQFYRYITTNSARDYLDTKLPMKNAITEDLKQAHKIRV